MGSRDARTEPACACGGRGMPRGSVLCLEHASLLGSLQLRPSVGAPAVCVVLRAALRLALGAAISPQPPSAHPGLF